MNTGPTGATEYRNSRIYRADRQARRYARALQDARDIDVIYTIDRMPVLYVYKPLVLKYELQVS